jgi:CheY-like chemotaxis protein
MVSCAAILVVEDEPDIRGVVVEYLRFAGFHVYEAENGKEALDILPHIPQPALILADLMMPVMDGPALIAALRDDDRFATLPVVIVTSADTAAPQGYRRLKKPFVLEDLLRIVNELCVRPQ